MRPAPLFDSPVNRRVIWRPAGALIHNTSAPMTTRGRFAPGGPSNYTEHA